MIQKGPLLLLLLCMGLWPVFAQTNRVTPEELFKTGIGLYSEGRFTEAAAVLRLVEPESDLHPDALYWTALTGLSSGDYAAALTDMSKLETAYPQSRWTAELPYHRGRCLFYQGHYEEAIRSFKAHADSLDQNDLKRGASYYWMGEAAFALGQWNSAADLFSMVMEKYPSSVKYEAASYRVNLINQKKVESELLSILRWSNEESLKTLEEYQNREKAYDLAITAYQQKITEMLAQEGGGAEDMNQLAEARVRIAALESSLAEANTVLEELRGTGVEVPVSRPPLTDTEKALRILELKAAVLELTNALNKKLGEEAE
ncbi:hypothetical protein AGMMS50230_22950 [Spirochaetia bacterium]|nr:hypothetical protein AGMMS50230_22950 [Spirochaetia bacterium]